MRRRNHLRSRRSGVSPLRSALIELPHQARSGETPPCQTRSGETPPCQAKSGETPLLRTRSGFTLLEVLLALALMVVVLGLLGIAVDVHVRVADASRNELEETQSARLLLRQIAADLRCAIPVTETSSSTSTSTSSSTTDSSTTDSSTSSSTASSTSSSLGCLQGDSHELQIDVSRMPFLDAMQAAGSNALPAFPPSDVRTISYSVAKPGDVASPEQSGGLQRRECERATFAWAVQQGQTDTFNRAIKVLSPDVESIEFAYIDEGITYQDWDSSEEGKLPAAVKISISMRHRQRKPQSLLSSTVEDTSPTVYSALVDLPNARASLSKTLAALGETSTSTQSGTATGSTSSGTGGTTSSQTKSTSSGG
jgi:prepilin-type N-terminal cleavage/methylation domain-containing protein